MACNNCNTGCNCTPCDIVGPQGPSGLKGAIGDIGLPGIQGDQGAQGDQGIIGEVGFDGIDGANGGAGSQGPQGIEGVQGPPGNPGVQGIIGNFGTDGVDGIDGIDGTDHPSIIPAQTVTGACNVINNPPSTEFLNCGGSAVNNGVRLILKKVGAGYYRIDLPNTGRTVGDCIDLIGFQNMSEWLIRTHTNNTVELSAFNSFSANISTLGGTTLPSGYRGVRFLQPNGSDCVRLLYIGSDRWVIIKAQFASGNLPIFT
jgi:hypothetical protein